LYLLTQILLRPRFPAYQDWADVATYAIAFLWGAMVMSDRRFEGLIRRQIGWLLAGGVVAMVGIGVVTYFTRIQPAGTVGAPVLAQVVQSILWSLFVWSWLLAVLYLGIRWLNFSNRAQRYAQESVLPVYVIHHPIVLVVASFVVTWNLGVWPKFLVILVLVAALTLAIYEFGVRRWPATRLLFGLSQMRHVTPSPSRTGGNHPLHQAI
jgi:hypothetical protein